MRKSLAGIPLSEMAMWVVIAGIALGVLSRSIASVLELTEKTALEAAVMNMRAGLRLEKARRIALGQSLRDLPQRNPLEFLRPEGAQGEWQALSSQVKPLAWVSDPAEPMLAYRPFRSRYLKLQPETADKLLVWRMFARAPDGSDAEIVLVTPYEWF